MNYEYRCSKNKKHITRIEYPLMSVVKETVRCSICKAVARRIYQSYGYKTKSIPATSETFDRTESQFHPYFDYSLGVRVSSVKQIDTLNKNANSHYVKWNDKTALKAMGADADRIASDRDRQIFKNKRGLG